ncbi:hypothetical protein LCGC14_2602760 [marine sediment metagenome]|uniref:Uncharacterized protein n=1 Tax=marine sediment metagenome TaxID=412755 RepID=A0A0F9A8A4_9ZZZZ
MRMLVLEFNDKDLPNKGIIEGTGIMITPPIDEDYWYFRVLLSDAGQAIVGFPKFKTIGIGFAQEEDWSSNLPFACSAAEIYNHIARNKGSNEITEADCVAAIEMVRQAARRFENLSDEEWQSKQERLLP